MDSRGPAPASESDRGSFASLKVTMGQGSRALGMTRNAWEASAK